MHQSNDPAASAIGEVAIAVVLGMEATDMQSSTGIGYETTRSTAVAEAPKSHAVTHEHDGRRLRAKGLGWFSVGLGLAEIFAPNALAELIGIHRPSELTKRTIQFYGLREVLAGVAILSRERPTEFIVGRVIGDAVDLASLGIAFGSSTNDRAKLAIATAAVAGVTALDIFTAVEHAKMEPDSDAGREWKRIKRTAAVTVKGTRDAVERAWQALPADLRVDGQIAIADAPGGRGVEVRIQHGKLGGRNAEAALRRMKSMVEIGELLVSNSTTHLLPHPGQPSKDGNGSLSKGKDVLR